MATTLAFDVYGTLIDVHGVTRKLQDWMTEDEAERFSFRWREKQLEYTFRRGLMREYDTLEVCTRQALDYTCLYFDNALSDKNRDELMQVYNSLPAFDDAKEGLKVLQDAGFRSFAFTNGHHSNAKTVLDNAGIGDVLFDVISVDAVKSFKPDPDVYQFFLESAGATPGTAWMVSSNPFDVIGAMNIGMKAIWVKRSSNAIFDPWGIQPTATISSIGDIAGVIEAF